MAHNIAATSNGRHQICVEVLALMIERTNEMLQGASSIFRKFYHNRVATTELP